jgi:hypothetical protein
MGDSVFGRWGALLERGIKPGKFSRIGPHVMWNSDEVQIVMEVTGKPASSNEKWLEASGFRR